MLCVTKGLWRASTAPEDGHSSAFADHVVSIFRDGGWCVCDGAHWLDVMKKRG
jgi:hypothetical protein